MADRTDRADALLADLKALKPVDKDEWDATYFAFLRKRLEAEHPERWR